MSDWDFLHDMQIAGHTPDQIADAAACGYNPWEWQPLAELELPTGRSQPPVELTLIFEDLVKSARSYHTLTRRYLQIWGELGELYAEIHYGIDRHKPHTQGSDGRLGNDFVEIKTISPEKDGRKIQVKRAGNFNMLLLVKIDENFEFQGQWIKRKQLKKGGGKFASATWKDSTPSNEEPQT